MVLLKYNEIIEQILHDYNVTFGTDFKILCDTRENLLRIEPTLILRENTAGVYHNASKTIFLNSEVIEKIKNKNYNNNNNQYDNGLSFLIHACFHELEHRLQSDYPQMLTNQKDIYPMMYQIEQFLISIYQHEKKYDEYAKLHDKFISEIDADIKGNRNSKTFSDKYGLPINPNYVELFNYYNIFRENEYEPLYFINLFNKKIKKYSTVNFINSNNPIQRQLFDFYNNNGNLKSIEEIMNLTNNPLLPYIVASLEFIQSINNKSLTDEQINFIYSNIKYVIDEHSEKQEKMKLAKERLQPRFDEFIEYTKISNKTSKSLDQQDYDELYKYLDAVASSLMHHMITDKKTK